jgi:hypothetical protein
MTKSILLQTGGKILQKLGKVAFGEQVMGRTQLSELLPML